MKRFSLTILILICTAAIAVAADLPTTYTVGGDPSEKATFSTGMAERTIEVNKTKQTVMGPVAYITVPLTRGQQTTDKVAERITDPKSVQLCVSYMELKGNQWSLIPQSEYCGPTEVVDANHVRRVYELPLEGNDFLLRVWGRAGEKWLWINQADPHHRLSTTSKPGYEAHVSVKDKLAEPVSSMMAARP